MSHSRKWILLLICFACGSGCHESKPTAAKETKPPAKIEKLPQETELAVVHLTPQAEERLGIATVPVEKRPIRRKRSFGGETLIPPGDTVVVSAPVTGTLAAPLKGDVPQPGMHLDVGRTVFRFLPLLTPERFVPTPAESFQMANAKASLLSLQIVAEGDVKQSQEEVKAAQIAWDRATQLLKDRAGSERAVDESKAQLAIAHSRLQAALDRKQVLDRLTLEVDQAEPPPAIEIRAPGPGILRTLPVALGQTVPAGTLLFEIVNTDKVWIRVPVYVGQLDDLDLQAEAIIVDFGRASTDGPRTATPVNAPPSADPLSSSADLYYELHNTDGRFRPGERVSVTLSLLDDAESLVAPAAAILTDIYGGNWVYMQQPEHSYRRARVVVRYLDGDLAVLAQGPPVGTLVVTDGAAELFGTEFGAGK